MVEEEPDPPHCFERDRDRSAPTPSGPSPQTVFVFPRPPAHRLTHGSNSAQVARSVSNARPHWRSPSDRARPLCHGRAVTPSRLPPPYSPRLRPRGMGSDVTLLPLTFARDLAASATLVSRPAPGPPECWVGSLPTASPTLHTSRTPCGRHRLAECAGTVSTVAGRSDRPNRPSGGDDRVCGRSRRGGMLRQAPRRSAEFRSHYEHVYRVRQPRPGEH